MNGKNIHKDKKTVDLDMLFKSFNNAASGKEESAIDDWLHENEDNKETYVNARDIHEAFLMETPIELLDGREAKSAEKRRKFRRIVLQGIGYAAVLAIFCVVGYNVINNRVENSLTATMNTVIVPAGKSMDYVLADGTLIKLNSGARLQYPMAFAKDRREVRLEGEAYFDVTHIEGSPFRVVMDEGAISVLGTEFCATSYPDEPMAATLVEGRIAFEAQDGTARELQPSQRLEYDRTTGGMQVEEVDTWLYTSWREDVFCFENRSLGDILSVLSRWYDVQVVFTDNALKEVRLSGTLEKYSAIEPFLRLFEAGADVEFKVSGRQITVAKRK